MTTKTSRIRLIELTEEKDEQLKAEAARDGMTPEDKARQLLLEQLADEEQADEGTA